MKRSQQYIFFLFLGLAFAACKKNPLPQEEKEEPVFYIKGEVNGAPISLEAGENEYYMFSSHYQDTNKVYVYSGELKQKACPSGCGYNIAIRIRDQKVSAAGAAMMPDSALFVGRYGFDDGTPEPVMYNCSFTPIEPVGPYIWSFSDGVSTTSQNGFRTLKAGKEYTVGLKVDNTMCNNFHENEFTIGSPLFTNITGSFDAAGSPLTYSFTSSNILPGVSLEWNFGDGTTSTAQSPVHTYTAPDFYIVRLKLSKPGEKTLFSYYQVAAWGSPVCTANYNSVFIPVPNPKALGAFVFELTDPSGKVYSSRDLTQPVDSKVEIVSVENYDYNSEHHPTKKLKVRFSCELKNGADVIKITNGEAVIAVSYK
jgi:hypothetical protein